MTQKEIAYLTEIIQGAIQKMQLIGSGENFSEIYNTVDAKLHYIQGVNAEMILQENAGQIM